MHKLSVIIPTYNNYDLLKRCIKSINSQTYKKKHYEVIIVNDGSTDSRYEDLPNFLKRYNSLKLSYFKLEKNRGPATARNFGVKKAKFKYVAFIDDDCIAHSNWLYEISKGFSNYKNASAIVGITRYNKRASLETLVNAFFITKAIESSLAVSPACNIAFKKKIFDTHAFDERMRYAAGEDVKFNCKLMERGYVFYKNEQMLVTHLKNGRVFKFLKQYFTYGVHTMPTQIKYIRFFYPYNGYKQEVPIHFNLKRDGLLNNLSWLLNKFFSNIFYLIHLIKIFMKKNKDIKKRIYGLILIPAYEYAYLIGATLSFVYYYNYYKNKLKDW